MEWAPSPRTSVRPTTTRGKKPPGSQLFSNEFRCVTLRKLNEIHQSFCRGRVEASRTTLPSNFPLDSLTAGSHCRHWALRAGRGATWLISGSFISFLFN